MEDLRAGLGEVRDLQMQLHQTESARAKIGWGSRLFGAAKGHDARIAALTAKLTEATTKLSDKIQKKITPFNAKTGRDNPVKVTEEAVSAMRLICTHMKKQKMAEASVVEQNIHKVEETTTLLEIYNLFPKEQQAQAEAAIKAASQKLAQALSPKDKHELVVQLKETLAGFLTENRLQVLELACILCAQQTKVPTWPPLFWHQNSS